MITETDNWNLLRAGATADLVLGAHVKLSLDAAYIYAWQGAVDRHLWTVVGYDPSSGTGNGVQLDAIVSYQFNDALSVGISARAKSSGQYGEAAVCATTGAFAR
jgi:hypothetical protein